MDFGKHQTESVVFNLFWLCISHKCLCEKNRCFRHCLKYTIEWGNNQQKLTIFTYNILKKGGCMKKSPTKEVEILCFLTGNSFFIHLFHSLLEKHSDIVYNKLVREIYPKWSEKDRKRGQQGGNRFE